MVTECLYESCADELGARSEPEAFVSPNHKPLDLFLRKPASD